MRLSKVEYVAVGFSFGAVLASAVLIWFWQAERDLMKRVFHNANHDYVECKEKLDDLYRRGYR